MAIEYKKNYHSFNEEHDLIKNFFFLDIATLYCFYMKSVIEENEVQLLTIDGIIIH